MDIRDPTLIDIRRQPLGSSRDKPGKERGRALYTKRIAAQAAVAGERAGGRAGYFGTLAVVAIGLSLFCIVRAYSQFHAQALAVMRSRLTSPDMLMANSPLPSPAKLPPFEIGALSMTLLPAASGR